MKNYSQGTLFPPRKTRKSQFDRRIVPKPVEVNRILLSGMRDYHLKQRVPDTVPIAAAIRQRFRNPAADTKARAASAAAAAASPASDDWLPPSKPTAIFSQQAGSKGSSVSNGSSVVAAVAQTSFVPWQREPSRTF